MGLSAQMKMDFMLGKALEMCRCLPTGFTDNLSFLPNSESEGSS